jgi:hypothetical protein
MSKARRLAAMNAAFAEAARGQQPAAVPQKTRKPKIPGREPTPTTPDWRSALGALRDRLNGRRP